MSPRKQMSPSAASHSIKTTADDVIKRHFLEMAHCEWIIDPLRLLIEWVFMGMSGFQLCISKITTSAVRAVAVVTLFTVCGEPPGVCLWMTSTRLVCCSAPHFKKKLVQMDKLQKVVLYWEVYFWMVQQLFISLSLMTWRYFAAASRSSSTWKITLQT